MKDINGKRIYPGDEIVWRSTWSLRQGTVLGVILSTNGASHDSRYRPYLRVRQTGNRYSQALTNRSSVIITKQKEQQ